MVLRSPAGSTPDEKEYAAATGQIDGKRRIGRGASGKTPSVVEARDLLQTDAHPPMRRDIRGREIDAFVSGHTHGPSLSRLAREGEREDEDEAVIVNSGCWIRQLRPVPAHFGGPLVFVSKLVQTHVRVFHGESGIHVELWELPGPAPRRLRTTEQLAVLGRLPARPVTSTKPRISMSGMLSGDRRASCPKSKSVSSSKR